MASRLLARPLLRCAAGTSIVARHDTVRAVVSVMIQQRQAPTMLITATRPFSSSSETLSDLLAREVEEEQELAVMPPELENLTEEIKAYWRIVDDDTEGTVKLFRKSGSVAIQFHCQESLPDMPGEGDEEEEEEEELSPPVRFTVTTSKAGKTLVMWCLSEQGEASVEGLAVSTADADAIFSNGINASSYQGPEFSELPEDVKDAFTDFLRTDCGVNSDVAAFIAMQADSKEQSQYVRFLNQVQAIIQ